MSLSIGNLAAATRESEDVTKQIELSVNNNLRSFLRNAGIKIDL